MLRKTKQNDFFIEVLHPSNHFGINFNNDLHFSHISYKIFLYIFFNFYKIVNFFLFELFFFWFCFLFTNYVFFSFVMHYTAILYLKSNNFIIFGDEQNRFESKTKSKAIEYSVTCLINSHVVSCGLTNIRNWFQLLIDTN